MLASGYSKNSWWLQIQAKFVQVLWNTLIVHAAKSISRIKLANIDCPGVLREGVSVHAHLKLQQNERRHKDFCWLYTSALFK